MPPLTLEQVLARSMRLPRQRTSQSVSSLFSKSKPSNESVETFSGSLSASDGAPSTSSTLFSSKPRRGRQARKDVLSFFNMVEELDTAKQSKHPTFQTSPHRISNSLDLLAHLEAAQRMSSWQDALETFSTTTHTTVQPSPESGEWEWRRVEDEGRPGVEPHGEHLLVLLDALVDGGRWDLVKAVGNFYGKSFPEVLTHVVRLLAYAAPVEGSVTEEEAQRQRATIAFTFLQQCPVPPPDRPVEAYTECLAAYERCKDWEKALSFIRGMGPNPLQGWRSTQEKDQTIPPGETETSALSPPSPNVVCYATLIAVLEQCGKEKLASEVLLRLPPLEQAEITASYAALIHVWSKQIYSKQQKRF